MMRRHLYLPVILGSQVLVFSYCGEGIRIAGVGLEVGSCGLGAHILGGAKRKTLDAFEVFAISKGDFG